jgi:Fe2+ or Zn2+ uptake regulation protein
MMNEGQQLEMFMTGEQYQAMERYVAGQNKDTEHRIASVERQLNVLLGAGLIEGVHFKNNFTVEENVTETVSLGGRWYDVPEFEAEVTYNKSEGGVFLLYDMVVMEDGVREVVKKSTYFNLTSEGKVECYTIVGSYRAVKPETILRKLGEMADAAKTKLKFTNQKDKHYDNAIAKLKLEFPNAVSVTKSQDWVSTRNYRNSYYVDLVTVAFEDDSHIQYDVNDFTGEIKVRKVYDVVVEKQTLQDKVNNLKNRLS